jgi:hypothetical protein
MSKLPISKEQEAEAVARIWNMGAQSLSPDAYGELEASLREMCSNRNIDDEAVRAEHIKLSGRDNHGSCSVNNCPAEVPQPCDCDG